MKPGALFFLLFLVVYMGFEIYAVEKTRYRMQPDHIYLEHVRAAHAASMCEKDVSEWELRFLRNFEYAQQRAESAEAEDNEAQRPRLALRVLAAEGEVDNLIASNGCDDIELWKLLRRYEILAKQNPPIGR
ncbi:MAG: hypothetical protein AAFN07_10145 [Pseudomonadota bacterium]